MRGFSHLDFPHWTRVILPALTRTVIASIWKTLSPESRHPYSTPSMSCSSRKLTYVPILLTHPRARLPLDQPSVSYWELGVTRSRVNLDNSAIMKKDLLPLFSHVERLKILGNLPITSASPGNDTERAHWLVLFTHFLLFGVCSCRKYLHESLLCCKGPPSPREMSKDVLPALRDLVLEGI